MKKYFMSFCCASIVLLLLQSAIYAQFTVTNTLDSGAGSFREALDQANTSTGPDSILFNIPTSDPGYDALTGVWTIKPLSPLPIITDGALHINGSSQAQYAGDLNPVGPEIQLDGSEVIGYPSHGLFILSGLNTIREIIINRFSNSGILLSSPGANENLIVDNYIGVNASASDVLPNGGYGVYIVEGARNSIGILQSGVNAITVGNSASKKPGANKADMKKGLIGGGNVVAGNLKGGIYISGEVANDNMIISNHVLSNFYHGIILKGSVRRTQIYLNMVAYNNGAGILIDGEGAVQNTILTNAITANALEGIVLNGGNRMMATPTILTVSGTSITGTSTANALVQFFGDAEDEGEFFLGEEYCDEFGYVTWTGPISGSNITATATDQNGNTSPFSAPVPFSSDILVTTTADTGTGSFRNALETANAQPGHNSILFQIPMSNDGYNADTGAWTIRPETPFVNITDGDLVIDGSSQSDFIGTDTNSEGPEIELDGSLLSTASCLNIAGSGVFISDLIINRFNGSGIYFNGVNSGVITGCYIGTDATGVHSQGNVIGIRISNNSKNVIIGAADSTLSGNLISGNKSGGVNIRDGSRRNQIIGNIIGPNSNNAPLQNSNTHGIYISVDCDSNEVRFNSIGSNREAGIYILANSSSNVITGNQIGTDENYEFNLGNAADGVRIADSKNNQILENVIGMNGNRGIQIFGAEAFGNSIRKNSISRNGQRGILIDPGVNFELPPPSLSAVTSTQVSGTAGAGQIIDIYVDEEDEGQIYIDSVLVNAAGHFEYVHQETWPLRNVTATATDLQGNTSEFSPPAFTAIEDVTQEQLPDRYSLMKNYPNPFNPMTTIGYQLPAPADVSLAVYNINGQVIDILVDGHQGAGTYHVQWKAYHVSSGIYLYRLTADEYTKVRKCMLLR
ncbi:MAG: right-handed parallel beta-helix repeat-containing protein [candidate division KSB1 bacterium]|nr:right-handed parallel beta-helix repeat-containing protein [candidate division KSB1 bacterium]